MKIHIIPGNENWVTDTGVIQTQLNDLLAVHGNYLNREWAVTHYNLFLQIYEFC